MKIGDHILVDGKIPATICYIGLVDNHPGQWIGIDYWNQQGKHNGIYQGNQYFQMKIFEMILIIRFLENNIPIIFLIYRQFNG